MFAGVLADWNWGRGNSRAKKGRDEVPCLFVGLRATFEFFSAFLTILPRFASVLSNQTLMKFSLLLSRTQSVSSDAQVSTGPIFYDMKFDKRNGNRGNVGLYGLKVNKERSRNYPISLTTLLFLYMFYFSFLFVY